MPTDMPATALLLSVCDVPSTLIAKRMGVLAVCLSFDSNILDRGDNRWSLCGCGGQVRTIAIGGECNPFRYDRDTDPRKPLRVHDIRRGGDRFVDACRPGV